MKNIPFGKPMLDDNEKNAVLEVLDSGILVHGKKIGEFEESFTAFTEGGFAAGVSSCTAALHLLYFSWGIGPGDEVIVPAQTHTATAHAVELVGAKPVFVDAEIMTGNIDIEQVEAKITEKTKAISLVHFLGMPVDMDKINRLAVKYSLKVVEDCALSIGATFKGVHTGLLGDAGCFSFYPVKHITTAEGGIVLSRHAELIGAVKKKRAFGMNKHFNERTIPGMYDMEELGFNYRMSEIHAAIGIEQLKKLPWILDAREKNYQLLESLLKNVDGITLFKSSNGDFKSSYYCLNVLFNDLLAEKRIEIMEAMKMKGIGISVYYPKAVPLMSYYKNKYDFKIADFPVAERISNNSIALPVGQHLNEDDMYYIAESLIEIVKKIAK